MIKNLSGDVKQNTEKEYKSNVLKEVAVENNPNLEQNQNDLDYLVQSQIVTEEKKEKLNITGPLIIGLISDKFEKQNDINIIIFLNIEEWNNSNQRKNELILELGSDMKVNSTDWRTIDANVTQKGFNLLKNKEYIMSIGIR